MYIKKENQLPDVTSRTAYGPVRRLMAMAVLLGFLIAPASSSAASDEEKFDEFILSIWLHPGTCSPENSTPITFQEIYDRAKIEEGQSDCVVVSGILGGGILFDSVRGYYLAGPIIRALNKSDAGYEHRLGVYISDEIRADLEQNIYPISDFAEVEIFGQLTTCEATEIWGGFCHNSGGPIILVSDLNARPIPMKRQTSNAAREEFGNLEEVFPGWPHYTEAREAALEWFRTIRDRDQEGYNFLVRRDICPGADDWEEEQCDKIFNDPLSEFAALRKMGPSPDFALFEWGDHMAPELLEDEAEDDPEDDQQIFSSVGCFCKDASCMGRWPIAAVDVRLAPERPYVCVFVSKWKESGQMKLDFEAEEEMRGLSEPK